MSVLVILGLANVCILLTKKLKKNEGIIPRSRVEKRDPKPSSYSFLDSFSHQAK